MAYATVANLAALGIRSETTEDIDTADLDSALASASSEADSYLAKVYTLPITAWGDALRMHVAAMAAYSVMAVRGFDPSGTDDVLRQRRDDAIAWLKMLAAGEITDPSIVDSTPDTSKGGAAVVTQPKRGW